MLSFLRPAALVGLIVLSATSAAFAAAPKGDAPKGLEVFKQRCAICHSTDTSGGPVLGPNLRGIVGRKAGSQPGFQMYSQALPASKLTWDLKTLDQYLTAPMNKVPGTTMAIALPDAGERRDVIAFLASLKP